MSIKAFEGKTTLYDSTDSAGLGKKFKDLVFRIFHQLLKSKRISSFTFLLSHIICYFQIVYFTLDLEDDNSSTLLKYSRSFLSVFHVYPYYKDLPEAAYYLVFSLCIVYIMSMYLLLFLTHYYGKKYSVVSWAVSWAPAITTQALYIGTNLGFIPILGTLLSSFRCNNGELYIQPKIICWSYSHIALFVISIIASIFLIHLNIITTLLLFDTTNVEVNSLSKSFSKKQMNIFLIEQILKIVLTALGIIGMKSSEILWALNIIVLVGYSHICYVTFSEGVVYHMKYSNIIWKLYIALCLWSCFPFFLFSIFNESKYDGAILINIEVGILIIAIIRFLPQRKNINVITMTPVNQSSIHNIETALDILIEASKFMENNKEYAIFFKGYKHCHRKVCKRVNCPLINFSDVDINKSKKKNKGSSDINNSAVLEYLNYELDLCIKKFPRQTSLRLKSIMFSFERLNNYYAAQRGLAQCEKLNPSFVEQFLIYRYKELIISSQKVKKSSQGMTIATSMEYERKLDGFIKTLNAVTQCHSQFWLLLDEESPNLSNIRKTGFEIIKGTKEINKKWNRLQAIMPNVANTLRLYANFYLYVLNDQNSFQILFDRSNEHMLTKNYKFKGFTQMRGNRFGLINDSTPCLIISGKKESYTSIVNCNLSLCREFGYQKNDIQGQPVVNLSPPILRAYHTEMLQLYSGDSDSILPLLYGLHRNGYIFPVSLAIVDTPNLLNEFNFVALIHTEKSNSNSDIVNLLIDNNLVIKGVTSSAIASLRLTAEFVRRNKIRLDTLCSGLNEAGCQKCLNENDVPMTYVCPEPIDEGEAGILQAVTELCPKLKLSEITVNVTCRIGEISSKSLGRIGYHVRFQILPEKKSEMCSHNLGITALEFQYDEELNRYIQVILNSTIKEKLNSEISNKCIPESEPLNSYKDTEDDKNVSEFFKLASSAMKVLTDFINRNSNRTKYNDTFKSLHNNLASHKRNYGKNVTILRLMNNEYVQIDKAKNLSIDIQPSDDLIPTANMKHISQKAIKLTNTTNKTLLLSRLNPKLTASKEVRPLRITVSIVSLLTIISALCIFLFILNVAGIENSLLESYTSSFRLLAEVHYSLFFARELQAIDAGVLNWRGHLGFDTDEEYINSTKMKLFNTADNIQEIIKGEEFKVEEYLTVRNVNVKHLISTGLMTDETLTFANSLIMLVSNIYGSQSEYFARDKLKSMYFIFTNGYNTITNKSLDANVKFRELASILVTDKRTHILVFTILGIAVLILYIPIMIYQVYGLQSHSRKIMELLLDLPYKPLNELAGRCDIFKSLLSTEVDYEERQEVLHERCEVITITDQFTRRIRIFTNNSMAVIYSIIGVTIIACGLAAYFICIYAMDTAYRTNYENLLDELTCIMRIEARFQVLINAEMECLYEKVGLEFPQRYICEIRQTTMLRMYELLGLLYESESTSSFTDYYATDDLMYIYEGNLCSNSIGIAPTLSNDSCETFAQATPTHGIQTLIVYLLKMLREFSTYPIAADVLLGRDELVTIHLLQMEFIRPFLREVVKLLVKTESQKNDAALVLELFILLTYIVGVIIIFLVILIFFAGFFERNIENAELMLLIIPIDILVKIRSISNYIEKRLDRK